MAICTSNNSVQYINWDSLKASCGAVTAEANIGEAGAGCVLRGPAGGAFLAGCVHGLFPGLAESQCCKAIASMVWGMRNVDTRPACVAAVTFCWRVLVALGTKLFAPTGFW